MIRPRFGTLRGLVRLALSYPQLFLGLGAGRPVDPATVRRLVFVCQGNICRSAFAYMSDGKIFVRPSATMRCVGSWQVVIDSSCCMSCSWQMRRPTDLFLLEKKSESQGAKPLSMPCSSGRLSMRTSRGRSPGTNPNARALSRIGMECSTDVLAPMNSAAAERVVHTP